MHDAYYHNKALDWIELVLKQPTHKQESYGKLLIEKMKNNNAPNRVVELVQDFLNELSEEIKGR